MPRLISHDTLSSLFNSVLNSGFLQSALTDLISGLGATLQKKLDTGDTTGAKQIAQDMHQNAQLFVGAAVKGTPAEKDVDPNVVKQAVDTAKGAA